MKSPTDSSKLSEVNLLKRPLAYDHHTKHTEAAAAGLDGDAERDRFGSYFEYLVSVLGFAAGFGSVWRFPYLVFKNGGGVFLIPYFLFLFLIAIPAFYFETALGQVFQRGPAQIFEKIHKKWKGIGLFQVSVSLSLSTYYNLILAYSLYFFAKSFLSPLPWKLDDHETHPTPWNAAYFYDDFLKASSGLDEFGGIVWPIFICYLLSLVIVYICIRQGVAVSGRIALFTATSPYVLLFILMIRGFFLEGAWTGISYLFAPDWGKLLSLQVWVDAANQVIFQMGPGCGALVFFGSYRNPKQEIKHSAVVIPLLTASCGILASLVIFTFMGYMSNLTNLSISEIPLVGPELAFVIFPAVLTHMPFSNLLSLMFFLIMIFLGQQFASFHPHSSDFNVYYKNMLGIDSQFAYVDCIAGAIEDEFRGREIVLFGRVITMKEVRLLLCVLLGFAAFLYCSQAGFYYLSFMDDYGLGINLLFAVCLFVTFFMWVEDFRPIEKAIERQIGEPTPEFFTFALKYIIPCLTAALSLLALIFQLLDITSQAWWVTLIGWSFTLYPYIGVFYYYSEYKSLPTKNWSIHSDAGNELEQELVEV